MTQLHRPGTALTGFGFGIAIGAAAGLIGVGGGEFRIPVLLRVLGLPVRVAAGSNTIIGLCVVTLSVVRRWGQHDWQTDHVALGIIMALVSVFGAGFGVARADRMSTPPLKKVVCAYLAIVGCWMMFESVARAEHTLMNPVGTRRWMLAAFVGLLVAVPSGALGVAGGELRIPALIYLFGIPVKEAGTISLLASVPTVAMGAIAYRRLGHVPPDALRVALVMGGGSILGVLAGAAWLPAVDPHTLKGILGVILLLATASLMTPGSPESAADTRLR